MSENTDITEQMSKIKTWGHIRSLNVSCKNKKGFYCRQLFFQNSIKGFPELTRSLRWEPQLKLLAAAICDPYSYSHLLASFPAPASAAWPKGCPKGCRGPWSPRGRCRPCSPFCGVTVLPQDRGRSIEQDPEERKVSEPQAGTTPWKCAGCRLQTAGSSSLQGFGPPRVYHAAPVIFLELSRAYWQLQG